MKKKFIFLLLFVGALFAMSACKSPPPDIPINVGDITITSDDAIAQSAFDASIAKYSALPGLVETSQPTPLEQAGIDAVIAEVYKLSDKIPDISAEADLTIGNDEYAAVVLIERNKNKTVLYKYVYNNNANNK